MQNFSFKRFKIRSYCYYNRHYPTEIIWTFCIIMFLYMIILFSGRHDSELLLYYKLERPSKGEEYQLDDPKTSSARNVPMLLFVQNILRLNGVEKGFFMECGARDGEYLSNTLDFERDHGWSGLLIEPDPVLYSRLLTKKRKSWTTNACLSTTDSEQFVKFRVNPKNRKLDSIEYIPTRHPLDPQLEEYSVQCVPLADLLFAIRVSSVDYFSLDIGGNELDILKTIPFDKILIKVLTVENNSIPDPDGPDVLDEFMKSKNYRLINPRKYMSPDHIRMTGVTDYVYVHSSLRANHSSAYNYYTIR